MKVEDKTSEIQVLVGGPQRQVFYGNSSQRWYVVKQQMVIC